MPSELRKSSVKLPVMYYFGNVTRFLGFLYFLEFSLFSVSWFHGVRSVKSLSVIAGMWRMTLGYMPEPQRC